MPTTADIIRAIEQYAPLTLQESWDNSGWQVAPLSTDSECTGVLLAVDSTPEVVDEARRLGCNLIVNHHPLLFHSMKRVVAGAGRVSDTLIAAVRAGINIYASHTPMDKGATVNLSMLMARRMGIAVSGTLQPDNAHEGAGLGVIGTLTAPMAQEEFLKLTAEVFRTPCLRVSSEQRSVPIETVAICTGAGGSLIADARRLWADAYITADVRHHEFLDACSERMLLVDVGHYEMEHISTLRFEQIISEKFPNFAVRISTAEPNPMNYYY